LAALLFFGGTLFPVLGLFNVYYFRFSFVADHFQYMANLGIIALFSAGAALLLKRWRMWARPAGYGLCFALLAALAIVTFFQSRMYASAETLYETTIARNPDCWMAHNNLGHALADRGQIGAAMAHFQKALEIKPDYAEAHNNLGNVLHGCGQLDLAITQYQRALDIKADYAEAHSNLAATLARLGQADAALAHYQKALQINPGFAGAHFNLGNVLADRGQLDLAIAHYQKAVKINPNFAEAHISLGNALLSRGEVDAAIIRCQKALEINPFNVGASKHLAFAISQREKILTALAEQREAIRLHPNDAARLNDAAWTLATNPNASVRNGTEAVELAERASKLSGDNAPAILATLAAAYAEAGRFSDALRTGQQAERLAVAAGKGTLAEQNRARQDLYKNGQPYRQLPSR
jgi:tetratricopeptide (TPR) repeat protein